jgi:membrane protein implicated in regulation of membrane protease activity
MDWGLIWIVAGLVLIVAEFFISTFVIIFLGIGALVTGIALWAGMTADHGVPYLVFAGVSVALLVLLRTRFKGWFMGRTLSADADDDFLGHEAVIESGFQAASPRRGKVAYRGASWDARTGTGPFVRGTVVRITGRQGPVLDVEAIKE